MAGKIKIFGAVFLIGILLPFFFVSAQTTDFENQVNQLKSDLENLEKTKETGQTFFGEKNELALRQSALFQVAEISLNENKIFLGAVLEIDNLEENVLKQLEDLISADNSWYKDFISKINLSSSVSELKNLALEVKSRRQEGEGLYLRKLIGLVLVLEQTKSIFQAQERLLQIEEKISFFPGGRLSFIHYLEQAHQEIITATQLVQSGDLRLKNMSSLEDFGFAYDWLSRANESLKIVYGILASIAEEMD